MKIDYLIIGGGIVGLSTAMMLTQRFPGKTVTVLEKERAIASHQSGRNSGVIHAGVYYEPGSLKAQLCRQGINATIRFCKQYEIAYEQCGKLLVATGERELDRMEALYSRCIKNGLNPQRLNSRELEDKEPNITGLGALYIEKTGIVDYIAMANKMAELVTQNGGEVLTDCRVEAISETADSVSVNSSRGTFKTKQLIVCGGLQADRLATMAGLETDFRIIPFRGEYYRLSKRHDALVNHLIYPISNPALPFLGVHLTRMIDGYVTVGPNAVLSFARERYGKFDFNPSDMRDTFGFPGFWRLAKVHWQAGLSEFHSSASKRRYLKLCQQYCPHLRLEDLEPYRAGIRAQAVSKNGNLIHDFLIKQTPEPYMYSTRPHLPPHHACLLPSIS